MTDLFKLIFGIPASRFKARATLEAENLVLRQQLNVLRRRTPKRPHLNNTDRFLFVWLYRWFPSVLEVVAIVRPETIIRWHRAGFRTYWRWRSLCLSEIKSGHIRDAIRRGLGGKEYTLPSLRCAIGAHPSPRPSACASHYSSERRISGSGADVPRLRQ
jgi:hypothetical protein